MRYLIGIENAKALGEILETAIEIAEENNLSIYIDTETFSIIVHDGKSEFDEFGDRLLMISLNKYDGREISISGSTCNGNIETTHETHLGDTIEYNTIDDKINMVKSYIYQIVDIIGFTHSA